MLVLNLDGATGHEGLQSGANLTVLGHRHARTAFAAIRQYLASARPSQILVFNHQLAVLLVLARFVTRHKFRIVARNISTLSEKRTHEVSLWHKHVVELIVRLLYRRVDHVIAQSAGMRDDLIAAYGFRSEHISVIHNPVVELTRTQTAEAEHVKAVTGRYFLCIGRLDPVKAFHFAIRALSAIVADFSDVRLKIVGSGQAEGSLKEEAERCGVADRIDFEGYQRDVLSYYEQAQATLLTSVYEGFPNVLLESLTAGTPVIAFDCKSGPREIVHHGVNGFLIPYQDVNSLAAHLAKALTWDWDRKAILDSAGRYSVEKIVRHYEEVLYE